MMISCVRKKIKQEGFIIEKSDNHTNLNIYKEYILEFNDSSDTKKEFKVIHKLGQIDKVDLILKQNPNDISVLYEFVTGWCYENNKESISEEFNEYYREKVLNAPKRFKKSVKYLDRKICDVLNRPNLKMEHYKEIIDKSYDKWIDISNEYTKISEIEKDLNIDVYEDTFPLARALKREIILHIGPTNSGKTYNAIKELLEANNGIYLAPLRLMANECYEEIISKNIPCNLITGEERNIDEKASFTSSTIEMCQFSKRVEVAVIDEIQMISDEMRGWAWSQALIGVSANKVILVGSEECLPYVIPIINTLGESYKIIKHERKTPLEVREPLTKYSELKEGDAYVVFSRKQALETKYILESSGFNCSIIYGNLSPEVRKNEAKKFREGQTKLLVATDAIGMGLNLPIKRVILSSIQKYDGKELRDLNVSEIKQIGGRAGRYGFSKSGEVALFADKKTSSKTLLERAIYGGYESTKDQRVSISPNLKQIQIICDALGQNNLLMSLIFFKDKLIKNNKLYKASNITPMIEIASLISKMNLSLETQFIYSCAPVDMNNKTIALVFESWIKNHQCNVKTMCPEVPPVNSLSIDDNLLIQENFVKISMLYRWLHFRFENHFPDIDNAIKKTEIANETIEKLLTNKIKIKQNGKKR